MFNAPLAIAVFERDFTNLNKEGRKCQLKKMFKVMNTFLEVRIAYFL